MATLNKDLYQTYTDSELSTMLSYYNKDYIFSVIRESLAQRLRVYSSPLPNIINSFELKFLPIIENYPAEKEEIMKVREETYLSIIEQLCEFYNLEFIPNDLDLYTTAYYLYDILVSRFQANIVDFYSLRIYNERNAIYDSLDRRVKDNSIAYGKKIYKNNKLSTIISHVDEILYAMNSHDITFEMFISSVCRGAQYLDQHILSTVRSRGDFFKDYCVRALTDPDKGPGIITEIRMNLQKIIPASEISDIDFTKTNQEDNI